MKVVLCNKKFKLSKLEFTEVPTPQPNDDQVLVKVKTTSINAADYRSLKMGMIPKKKILGAAVAGIIEEVGANIQQFKIGDEVVGDLSDFGFGGFAEYAVAPEKAMTIKPTGVTFEDVATLPVAATTALKALRDKGNVQKGQQVLIVGASGGVGTFAIQIAKYFEAHVTAVCSTRNIEQAKMLGADLILDYKKEELKNINERFDLVLGVNGNYSLFTYKRLLKPKGTYVMVGGKMSQIFRSIFFGWLLSFGSKKLRVLSSKSDPKDLALTAKLMEQGTIKAVIEKQYTLEQTPEAMTYLMAGHVQNKIIITV